jgi:ribosome-binding protein aMBF1 (putative translation factor)
MTKTKDSTPFDLPVMFDPRTGGSVVVPISLFAQLVGLATRNLEVIYDSKEQQTKIPKSEMDEAVEDMRPALEKLIVYTQTHRKEVEAICRVLDGAFDSEPAEEEKEEDDDDEAADIAAAAAVDARREEYFPAELVDRLIDGEHPVKVFREYRGLTQVRLAEKARINPTYLSQIETRRRTGSTALLRRLATALDVTVDDLLEDDEQLGHHGAGEPHPMPRRKE